MAADTLTVTDNRTGKQYELPIEDGAIRASRPRPDQGRPDDLGLMPLRSRPSSTRRPARAASPTSTATRASCATAATRSRSSPRRARYLETAYLIVKGELPDARRTSRMWTHNITIHTMVHENIKKLHGRLPLRRAPDGHADRHRRRAVDLLPRTRRTSTTSESRRLQTRRLIGKMPTIAAFAYRHSRGLPYVYPDNELCYTGNFLYMLFKMTELQLQAEPGARARARRALHPARRPRAELLDQRDARRRQLARRSVLGGRRRGAPRSTARCHGGANEDVRPHAPRDRLGRQDSRAASSSVKAGERRLMGFGHRVYKNYDPRAKIIKKLAYEVFEVTGKNPLIDIALELERIALAGRLLRQAQALPERRLLLGHHLPGDGLPGRRCSRCCSRSRAPRAGSRSGPRWCSDEEQRISRPRQLYIGEHERTYEPIEARPEPLT